MTTGVLAAKRSWEPGWEGELPDDHPLVDMARTGRRLPPDNRLAVMLLGGGISPTNGRSRGPRERHSVLIGRSCGGLGDVLMTSVAVRAYRRSHPRSRITYALPSALRDTQINNPDVDEVVEWTATTPKTFDDFDEVYDLSRIDHAYEREVIPHVDKSRMEIYAEALHVEPTDWRPFYRVERSETEAARRFRVPDGRLHIGLGLRSASPLRDMDRDRWVELSAILVNRLGVQVVLFDRQASFGWDGPYVTRACGLPVRDMAAIFSTMDAVVVLDSGLLHLAGALGLPTVALFGSTDPRYRADRYPSVKVCSGITRCRRAPCWCGPGKEECRRECMAFDPVEIFWALLYALGPGRVAGPWATTVDLSGSEERRLTDSGNNGRRWSTRRERPTVAVEA